MEIFWKFFNGIFLEMKFVENFLIVGSLDNFLAKYLHTFLSDAHFVGKCFILEFQTGDFASFFDQMN